jgi:hypothetical protein
MKENYYILLGNSFYGNTTDGNYLLKDGEELVKHLGTTLAARYTGRKYILSMNFKKVNGQQAHAWLFDLELEIDGVVQVVPFLTASSTVTLFLVGELKEGENALGSQRFEHRGHVWYYPTVNGMGIGLFGKAVKVGH